MAFTVNYKYSYSYKDLVTEQIVDQVVDSPDKLSLDELFLDTFVFLTNKIYPAPYGGSVDYEGGNEFYPLSISNLRDKSAINFKKMEFTLISGEENLKKSRGFGRKS